MRKTYNIGKDRMALNLLKIRKITVGPLMTDCYILSNSGECVIMDAGGNGEKIMEEIEKFDLKPKFIIATHGHFDHFLSAAYLQKNYDIPFYINAKDRKLMTAPEFSPDRFIPGLKAEIPENILTFEDGFKFSVGEHQLQIMETSGHTPGSSCIIGDGFILSGDTLFRLSIGRTDIGGNDDDMLRSLKMITQMKESTRIYPGHGEPSDIRYELLNNVYFQNVANRNSRL
ncbi:MAG: MBL fold metallo-hydrolase [Cuniculiplasma sp.]